LPRLGRLPTRRSSDLISAKVLALHGNDDPLAPPDDVRAFQEEMTRAGADWQLHIYGGTQHAFTNPKAANPDAGLVYHPVAERRADRKRTRLNSSHVQI